MRKHRFSSASLLLMFHVALMTHSFSINVPKHGMVMVPALLLSTSSSPPPPTNRHLLLTTGSMSLASSLKHLSSPSLSSTMSSPLPSKPPPSSSSSSSLLLLPSPSATKESLVAHEQSFLNTAPKLRTSDTPLETNGLIHNYENKIVAKSEPVMGSVLELLREGSVFPGGADQELKLIADQSTWINLTTGISDIHTPTTTSEHLLSEESKTDVKVKFSRANIERLMNRDNNYNKNIKNIKNAEQHNNNTSQQQQQQQLKKYSDDDNTYDDFDDLNKTLYLDYLEKNYLSYIDDMDQVTGAWNEDTAIIISASFNFILFIFSTLGNSLVVFTMLMDKRWHSTISLFLLSLAMADLLFLIVCLPYEMTIRYAFKWTGSRIMCKLAGFVEMLVACTSVFNLVAVSIERYTVIVHPIKSKIWCSKGRTQKIIISIWMAGAILASPMAFVMDTTSMAYFNNKETVIILTCAEKDIPFPARVAMAWYQLTIMFLLPSAILAFCYSRVISVLWISTKRLYNVASDSNEHGDDLSHTTSQGRSHDDHHGRLPVQHQQEQQYSTKKRIEENLNCPIFIKEIRKQIIRMLLMVVLIFFICWGPKQIMLILKRHKPEMLQSDEVFYVMLLFNSLPYVQSLANPFIYCFMSKNFRRSLKGAFKRLLRRCGGCCSCCHKQDVGGSHRTLNKNSRMTPRARHIQQADKLDSIPQRNIQGTLEVRAVSQHQAQHKRQRMSLCQNFKNCGGYTRGEAAGEIMSPGATGNTPANPALPTELAVVETVTRSEGTAKSQVTSKSKKTTAATF